MTVPALAVQVQGQGSVTADQLNTMTQWCLAAPQLRAVIGLSGMSVLMLGTATPSDGGQGYFWWNSASTAPDDNGVTTIKPPGVTGSGAWQRLPITVSAIPAGSLSLTQLQNIPSDTILGNVTATPGPPQALTPAQVASILGPSGSVPTGSITMFGASIPPTGWLVCDGSAVSRTTYAALFAVISTTFGPGDGATTFNLPSMLGRFARGWDSSGSVDPGRTFGSTQASALQSHQHIAPSPEVYHVGAPTGPWGSTTISDNVTGFQTAGTGTDNYWLTNDGTPVSAYNPNPGGQVSPTETRPTNVALAYIIKY